MVQILQPQRTFQFRRRAARRAYACLRKSHLPLPNPFVLWNSRKLDEWAGQGGWQKLPHPCICKDGASGCPAATIFIQFAQGAVQNVYREVIIRIIGPHLTVVGRVTVALHRRGARIDVLDLEWRIGEIPQFLSGNGR